MPNLKQVGDRGVDGRATLAYPPYDCDSRLGLAQVKGGRGFHLGSLRDYLHVNDRENAAVGCYIALEEVGSREARKEIANSGEIHVNGYQYPRMQLWSVGEYFEGRFPNLPLMNDPFTGKPIQLTLF